jgi:hypothetical protein
MSDDHVDLESFVTKDSASQVAPNPLVEVLRRAADDCADPLVADWLRLLASEEK